MADFQIAPEATKNLLRVIASLILLFVSVAFQRSCAYYTGESSVRAKQVADYEKDLQEVAVGTHQMSREVEFMKTLPEISGHIAARLFQMQQMNALGGRPIVTSRHSSTKLTDRKN